VENENSGRKMLIGLGEISKFYGRSPKTIKIMIKADNFPAVFICGRWESNKDLIDSWHKTVVSSGNKDGGDYFREIL